MHRSTGQVRRLEIPQLARAQVRALRRRRQHVQGIKQLTHTDNESQSNRNAFILLSWKPSFRLLVYAASPYRARDYWQRQCETAVIKNSEKN